ncbi:PilZ domain-containing protein [Sphingorhabdus sp.]|jgi:hypothetical protein|uniref:PilZ domain-containing protein n=1 Tax=Sphingorhabdus sp. TaxID=1902408 RepID=UPI0029D4944E|nr:PilZ domain-containing protein [Sphingomonadaceae bacterium]
MRDEKKGHAEPAFIGEARRHDRGHVDIVIDVRESGGGRHQAHIVDLSQSGCRIASATYLNENRHIFITLPGFTPLEAEVVWKIKDVYGCAFFQPLHPAIFDHIVAKYPSLGGA